jgi:hypothetical protein
MGSLRYNGIQELARSGERHPCSREVDVKRWIVALVLGVPALVVALLLAFAAAMVLIGVGDPLQPALGTLRPSLGLVVWLWLGGAAMASAILLIMAWFAPWGILFARRSPRERFQAERGDEP